MKKILTLTLLTRSRPAKRSNGFCPSPLMLRALSATLTLLIFTGGCTDGVHDVVPTAPVPQQILVAPDGDSPRPALKGNIVSSGVANSIADPMVESSVVTAANGETVIDFEGHADLSTITTQYSNVGVTFANATILHMGGSLNPPYPPRSGVGVIFDNPSPVITVSFVTPVSRAGGYVTGKGPVSFACFNSGGNTLGSAGTPAANYVGAGTGLPQNIPLFVDATNISRCTFTAVGKSAGNNFTVDDFTFVAGCNVNATLYGQGSLPWGPTQYDNIAGLMKAEGCALTSIVMGLTARGFAWTPGTLNELAKNPPGTYFNASGWVVWDNLTALGGGTYSSLTRGPVNASQVDAALCSGRGVVVGVSLDAKGAPGHFVLIVGRAGADYRFYDPGGDGAEKSLFATYGTNLSMRGSIGGGSSAQFLVAAQSGVVTFAVDDGSLAVTDASGRVAGINLATGVSVDAIPGATAWSDRRDNFETGQPGSVTTAVVRLEGAFPEVTAVTVTPIASGIKTLNVWLTVGPGQQPPPLSVPVIATAGEPTSLQIVIDPSGSLSAVRTGGFAGLRQDIRNAHSLGLIRNGVDNSLLQKVDAAQLAFDRGQHQTVLAILDALRTQIQSLQSRGIDPVVAKILLDDISGIETRLE